MKLWRRALQAPLFDSQMAGRVPGYGFSMGYFARLVSRCWIFRFCPTLNRPTGCSGRCAPISVTYAAAVRLHWPSCTDPSGTY